MSVRLSPGAAFLRGVPCMAMGELVSDAFVAPVSDDRVDFVGLNALTQSIYIIPGEEGDTAIPTPPDPDTTYPPLFPVCAVYHRPGEASIKTEDDSTNGYIVDLRPIPEPEA